jgi:hypothetical protein
MDYTDTSQKKHKWLINKWKKFNIFTHQGKTYQNYIEIQSHSSQNGYDQEKNKINVAKEGVVVKEKETSYLSV